MTANGRTRMVKFLLNLISKFIVELTVPRALWFVLPPSSVTDSVAMTPISFTFYIFVILSPDDGRNCRPKHVAYMRNI